MTVRSNEEGPLSPRLIVLLRWGGRGGLLPRLVRLFEPQPRCGRHKVNINLTVDQDKMQADADTMKNKAARLAGKVTEEVKAPGDFDKRQSEVNRLISGLE